MSENQFNPEKETNNTVDDIFAQADIEMNNYRESQIREQKEKKRIPRWKKIVLEIVIALVTIAIIVISLEIYTISKTNPVLEEMKVALIESYSTFQEELKNKNEDTLTEKEKIQKELVMLLDKNDLQNILAKVSVFDLTKENADIQIDRTMVSEEKYQRIQELQKKLIELEKQQENQPKETTSHEVDN